MVQLPGSYILNADKHAITLCKKRAKGGRLEVQGYYTTLIEALTGWRRKIARDILQRKEVQTMSQVLTELRQMDEEAEKIISKAEIGGAIVEPLLAPRKIA